MDATEARARAVALRQQMRAELAQLDELAQQLQDAHSADRVQLPRAAKNLSHVLQDAIAEEEAVLAPVLGHIDAWGKERLERLEETHALVKEHLVQLEREVCAPGLYTMDMVRAARQRTADLLKLLSSDERVVLSADVLRDDPIVVGQTDG